MTSSRVLGDTSEQHEKNTQLDVIMSVNVGEQAVAQILGNVRVFTHFAQQNAIRVLGRCPQTFVINLVVSELDSTKLQVKIFYCKRIKTLTVTFEAVMLVAKKANL